MPTLGSSNSMANKDNDGKNMDKWGYSYLIEFKTLWEKEKLLITSNFSFSHNVFKSSLVLMRQNEYLWSNGLTNNKTLRKNPFNPFPNKPWFLRVCCISLLKTLRETEKLLVTNNFSFSLSVYYPSGQLSAIFIKFEIVVCKPFQFRTTLEFVVWERVKNPFGYQHFLLFT